MRTRGPDVPGWPAIPGAAVLACHSVIPPTPLLAVNFGDDADTTGAVFGQLAGAYYGEDGIPQEWLAALARRDEIVALADRLVDLQP